MWMATLPFCELHDRARWKVEFFCGASRSKLESAFDIVPLREVFQERRESLDPQAFSDHMFNFVGLENVQSLTGDIVDFQPRPGREILSRCKVFRSGDVLYGRLRPYLNKVFLASDTVLEGICSGEFYVLTPEMTRICPRFARAILTSKYIQHVVAGLLTGSALPRLQLDDLLEIEVPLPPMTQQRLIEKFIVREDSRRRALAAKLVDWPSATIEAVVNSLESGKKPLKLFKPRGENGNAIFGNRLPPGDFFSGKSKRAPAEGQALIELS